MQVKGVKLYTIRPAAYTTADITQYYKKSGNKVKKRLVLYIKRVVNYNVGASFSFNNC